MRTKSEPFREQFTGAILGLAIGDAIGYPCEFRRRKQILEVFGSAGVTDLVGSKDPRWPEPPYIIGSAHPPGTYTDDTQMSIATARGLLEAPLGDLEASMSAIATHFVIWAGSDDNDRSPGATCMTGCRALARGVPWREAGVADSKGCGSAMRVAPIGLLYADDEEALLRFARASSLLTHGHDAAVEGAGAAALLVARALRGDSPSQMYEAVARHAGASADFDACWQSLAHWREHEPERALSSEGIGESWVAEEAVASALYCFARSPNDFRQIVLTAANTDGDSDSIACIAGGIAGAALGEAAIPPEWLEGLEKVEMLRELGNELWERFRAGRARRDREPARSQRPDGALSSG